jgi:hypothetical protein
MSPYDLNPSNCSSSSLISKDSRSNSSSIHLSIPIALKATRGPRSNNHRLTLESPATLGNMALPDSVDGYRQHLTNAYRDIPHQDCHSISSYINHDSPTQHTDVNDESIFQLDLEQPGFSKRTNDVYSTLGYKLVRRRSKGQPYRPRIQAERPSSQQTRQTMPRFHPLRYVREDVLRAAHSGPIISKIPILTTPPTPLLSPRLAESSVEYLPLLYDQADLPLTSLAVPHCEMCIDETHEAYQGSDTVSFSKLQGQVSWVAGELQGVTLTEQKSREDCECMR